MGVVSAASGLTPRVTMQINELKAYCQVAEQNLVQFLYIDINFSAFYVSAASSSSKLVDSIRFSWKGGSSKRKSGSLMTLGSDAFRSGGERGPSQPDDSSLKLKCKFISIVGLGLSSDSKAFVGVVKVRERPFQRFCSRARLANKDRCRYSPQ